MKIIDRTLKTRIIELNKEYSCILLTGPRQVGKSTLFAMVSDEIHDTTRKQVTLDDMEQRMLARRDPAMFLATHGTPILIDEVQYAPELFSYIKIVIDKGAAPGDFWLTGSQPFRLMELARESLAGRAAVLALASVSQQELYGDCDAGVFTTELDTIKKRISKSKAANIKDMYERIWMGSLPALVSGKYSDRDIYYSSYLQTYIDRDVSDIIEGVDKLLFRDFIRAAACRIGEVVNVHAMAEDVGINDNTAKRWLQVLEKSYIITLLRPYSNNALHRTIKAPKLYFFDTGLVAYLTKYPTAEILSNSALAGPILENYIVMEIIKSYQNNAKEPLIWYYRDRDNKEIDIVLEDYDSISPIEIKRSINPGTEIARSFKVLDKSGIKKGTGAIICMREDLSAINSDNLIIPAWCV